jgi:hypothetical protein
MITKEQKQKIIYDLLAKNLPLDLLVEIKDHMEEQLESKLEISKLNKKITDLNNKLKAIKSVLE